MSTIIGRNLKILRESNGYTQEKMAEFLGISRSAYANYESLDREPPLSLLEEMADFFGVSMSVFFETDVLKVKSRLLVAFRAEDLSVEDMKQVADFKRVAMEYLKMNEKLGL